jgi:hypothetical protein
MAQSSWTGENLYSVWLVDAAVGLTVGANGVMLRTNNGGQTWLPQTSETTNSLRSVRFASRSHGVVVGDHGMILVTGLDNILSEIGNFEENAFPRGFALVQNYPNPFNTSTVISFRLATNSFVSLKIYDVLGRLVATPLHEPRYQGVHTVQWRADMLPSGVYFYRLQAYGILETKKMVLTK